MGGRHSDNKAVIARLRGGAFSKGAVREALAQTLVPDAVVHMCHPPFGGDLTAGGWFDTCFAALFHALPDLERRDWIVLAGPDGGAGGDDWVGCGGHYVGTFAAPFLDIPPTGQFAHMRFHEFYRLEAGRVVEVQAIWDIPELMMQAGGAWPLAPSLGREGWCLAPPRPWTA